MSAKVDLVAKNNLAAKNNPPTYPKSDKEPENACGKSFTTATDPKNVNVKQSLGGSVTKIETKNDDGDVQIKILKSDGSSVTFAEDGSVIVTTALRNGDPTTGRFDVSSQGSTRFKIGESFLIEVGNKNNVTGGKDGKEGKAMSIVVYGNVDLTAHGGELNARAKNISLIAENELNLKAGSKISLLSGEGKGKNSSGKPDAKATEKEYGGVVEIKCGDLYNNALTVRGENSVDYKVVEGEQATISTKDRGNIGFLSPGSFTLDVAGDLYEVIGGKRRTDIFASSELDPTKTIFKDQSEGWLVQIGPMKTTGSSSNSTTPMAFSVSTSSGGMSFYTKKGDVDIYTESGYWGMGNKDNGVIGIDKTIASEPNAKPGAYLVSKTKPVTIRSTSSYVEVYASTIQKSGIKLDKSKIEIKNPTGIYLN